MKASPRFFAMAGLLFAACLWGTSFLIAQETMTSRPLFLNALRMFLGAVGILAFNRRAPLQIHKKEILPFVALGILIALTFAPQTFGLKGTSIANSVIITSMFVVLTPFALKLAFRRTTTLMQWAGSIIGMSAFVVLGVSQGLTSLTIYDAVTFITPLAISFHTPLLEATLKNRSHFFGVLFYQFLFASIAMAMGSLFIEGNNFHLSSSELSGVVFLAFVCTTFCYFLQARAQLILGTITVTLLISSEPLWAIAVANVFKGDPITGAAVLACALLLMANVVSELKLRPSQRNKRPHP